MHTFTQLLTAGTQFIVHSTRTSHLFRTRPLMHGIQLVLIIMNHFSASYVTSSVLLCFFLSSLFIPLSFAVRLNLLT
jgi:hypothetical protein